jgi:hypothetical protein
MRVLGAVLLVASTLTAWGSNVRAAQTTSTTNQAHEISVGDQSRRCRRRWRPMLRPARLPAPPRGMKLRSESPPVACACFSTRLELQLLSDWTRHLGAALKARQLRIA